MCSVQLGHRDKSDKCGFFVVPKYGLALQGVSHIKLLETLKIMHEMFGDLNETSKCNSETMQASNNPSCKANKAQQIKEGNVDVNDTNSNIPDYLRFSINRAAAKRVNQV